MADSNIITMIVTQNEKVTDPGEVAPEKTVIIELLPEPLLPCIRFMPLFKGSSRNS